MAEQDQIAKILSKLQQDIVTAIQLRRFQAVEKGEDATWNDLQYAVAASFTEVEPLIRDLIGIADESMLPDGDGVNVPTALWAQGWVDRLVNEEENHGKD